MIKNFIIFALVAVCTGLSYLSYMQAHELRWAKYDLYQEEATTFQLMMNGICRYPDNGWPEFCEASNGGRQKYLEWYAKTMKRPIPEFPS
jgi:hypothetical protein